MNTAHKLIKEYEIEITQYKANSRVYDNADVIIEGLKQDLAQLHNRLVLSETARVELQEQLKAASVIDQDSSMRHEKYQGLILQENEELRKIVNQKDQ